MTSSSPSSARRGAVARACRALVPAVLLLGLAGATGCGKDDGSSDYRDGLAAFASGDLAKAERGFRGCLEAAPSNVDALLMLARTEMQLGEFTRAHEAVSKAEALAGADPDVLELAGQVAYHLQDFDKARAAFSVLVKNAAFDDAVRSRGYAGLGVVEYAGIRPEGMDEAAARARTAFLMAIRLDNRNAAAHYNLGRLYSDFLHYPAVARDEFALFTHLAPSDDPRVVHVRDNLMPELKARLDEAIQGRRGGKPQNMRAAADALQKAGAAMAKGQYKTAKALYAQALAADALSHPAAMGLAACAEKEGTRAGLEEARRNYQLASELRPSDAKALMALGDVAVRVGSPAVAEKAYSRAVAAAVGADKMTALRRLEATLRKNGKTRVADVYQRYADDLAAARRR